MPKAPSNFIHPDKMKWINSGDEELNALLPTLSEQEHTYLQLIASENYKNLVANLKKYLGIHPTREDVPQLFGTVMAAVKEITMLEASHKAQLEELALNTVLGLEEFEGIQQAYIDGVVKFKVELAQPTNSDYEGEQPPQAPPGELTEEEKLNQELAKMFQGVNLADLNTRRRLANLLITGGAFSKMYLFHLVEPKLNAISPKLIKLYGTVGAAAEFGYWYFGENTESARSQVGVEQVIPDREDGTYTIKAKAINFPYLIHELVKGIYEWLSIDPEMKAILGQEEVKDETRDVLAGPALFKKILGMIPPGKQNLMPGIQRKLVYLPTAEAQEVLRQSPKGAEIFNRLVAEAENEWNQYKQNKDKYNEI